MADTNDTPGWAITPLPTGNLMYLWPYFRANEGELGSLATNVRAYYHDTIPNFLRANQGQILGELTSGHHFDLDILQKNSWVEEIALFKRHLQDIVFYGFVPPIPLLERVGCRHGLRVVRVQYRKGIRSLSGNRIRKQVSRIVGTKRFTHRSRTRTRRSRIDDW